MQPLCHPEALERKESQDQDRAALSAIMPNVQPTLMVKFVQLCGRVAEEYEE